MTSSQILNCRSKLRLIDHCLLGVWLLLRESLIVSLCMTNSFMRYLQLTAGFELLRALTYSVLAEIDKFWLPLEAGSVHMLT